MHAFIGTLAVDPTWSNNSNAGIAGAEHRIDVIAKIHPIRYVVNVSEQRILPEVGLQRVPNAHRNILRVDAAIGNKYLHFEQPLGVRVLLLALEPCLGGQIALRGGLLVPFARLAMVLRYTPTFWVE